MLQYRILKVESACIAYAPARPRQRPSGHTKRLATVARSSRFSFMDTRSGLRQISEPVSCGSAHVNLITTSHHHMPRWPLHRCPRWQRATEQAPRRVARPPPRPVSRLRDQVGRALRGASDRRQHVHVPPPPRCTKSSPRRSRGTPLALPSPHALSCTAAQYHCRTRTCDGPRPAALFAYWPLRQRACP